MRCEICKKTLIIKGDLREDGSEECPDKHYFHHHSYGNHEEYLDATGHGMITMSIRWSYLESEEISKKRNESRKAFIEYAKEFSK